MTPALLENYIPPPHTHTEENMIRPLDFEIKSADWLWILPKKYTRYSLNFLTTVQGIEAVTFLGIHKTDMRLSNKISIEIQDL